MKGCNKESFKTKISSKWLKFDHQKDNGFRDKTKFKRFTNYFYRRYTLSCLDHQWVLFLFLSKSNIGIEDSQHFSLEHARKNAVFQKKITFSSGV